MGTRWRRWKRWIGLAVALAVGGFLILNVMAFYHARAMMRFTAVVQRTHEPEALSLGQKLKVLCCGIKVPRPVNQQSPADFGLGYETVTFSGAHGLKLEAWQTRQPGSRGVVLLFHGYTASKESLLPAAREFAAMGFSTLLVDFYGSGGSAGNETSVGWYEAEDVAAAWRWVRKEMPGQPVVLYGVSMGAAAAIRAVGVLGIEPDAMIVECPFDRLLTTVENRFHAMRLPAFPAAQLLVFWGGVQQGFNGFAFNPADYLRAVRCPVLLMHGGQDSRVKPWELENLARSLNGQSACKVFPAAPHGSYVTSHAQEWRATASDFLRGAHANAERQPTGAPLN